MIEAILALAENDTGEFFFYGVPGIVLILFSGVGKFLKNKAVERDVQIKKTEEELYGQIYDEIENNQIDRSLWVKAEAESDGGDEKKVKSIYIKLRYKKLIRNN